MKVTCVSNWVRSITEGIPFGCEAPALCGVHIALVYCLFGIIKCLEGKLVIVLVDDLGLQDLRQVSGSESQGHIFRYIRKYL